VVVEKLQQYATFLSTFHLAAATGYQALSGKRISLQLIWIPCWPYGSKLRNEYIFVCDVHHILLKGLNFDDSGMLCKMHHI
jgi:hypothetical protein